MEQVMSSGNWIAHDVKFFLATPIQTEDQWLALADIDTGAVVYVENQSELNMFPEYLQHVYKVWVWEFDRASPSQIDDSGDSDTEVCDGICTASEYQLCFSMEQKMEFFRLMGVIAEKDADSQGYGFNGLWSKEPGRKGRWSIKNGAC